MPIAVFSTAAVTVGGLYQVTGSVAVTITGTATGVLLAGWGANQDKPGPGPGTPRSLTANDHGGRRCL